MPISEIAAARLAETKAKRRKARIEYQLSQTVPQSNKGYETLWKPQYREDGSPGPQVALVSCPFPEILFGGARGGGKALPLDENVLTPSGYRKMGSLVVGDQVCSPGGDVSRIVGVFPQGNEAVYKIVLSTGQTARASADHLWLTRFMVGRDVVRTLDLTFLVKAGIETLLPVGDLGNWLPIKSIERDGYAQTQCIKIDREDGLFITNDNIVTHNTDGALGCWLAHAARYGEHAKGVFFRRRFKQLEEVQNRCNMLFPKIGALYHKGDAIWVFPNGASLKLRHLWDESSCEEYQGHQYTYFAFEECTNWPTPAPIDKMRATLRSAHGVETKIILTANPGGAGHNWVRSRYINPAPKGYTPIQDSESGEFRVFIPSRLEDNLALYRNDPNYERRLLQSGNAALVKAWRWGDWTIIDGGFFDDLFDPDKHLIAPFDIPSTFKWRRSFDWGSAAPASLGIWAVSDGSPVPDLDGMVFPRGSVIRVGEWYTVASDGHGNLKANEGLRLTNIALGNGIGQRTMGRTFSGCVADPSIFAKPGRDSIYSEMQKGAMEVGHQLNFQMADNARIAGWQRMRDMLEQAAKEYPEKPGMWAFETCVHYARTIPVLQRKENEPDEVDTTQEDHVADECRYLAMTGARTVTTGTLTGM